MKDTNSPPCCPKCGGPIPAEARQGLCPKCALAAVAAATEADPPTRNRDVLPSVETVAAAFPQLEILEPIGAGGMGSVFKARQPKLDRVVALKLLSQSLALSPAFAERFHREARVLARLNHPGIVSVHDFGEAGGFFFLLMEYVDGVNLRQAMEAGRFAPDEALALVPRICEALQFAHDEGILHRDIKPENILLDARGRVKIVDFGIAKLLGDKKGDAILTGSGIAVGTPHYMAPEQLSHPQDVDPRADIYSLGVVLYEMLTGELPIGRFAAPSRMTPLDPRVDDVVLRALEKDRNLRQRNATEVKEQVETIASRPPTPAMPVPENGANPELEVSLGGVGGGTLETSRAFPIAKPFSPARSGEALREEVLQRSPCFSSSPDRMRNSFPGPQAHIFQCRGELRLEGAELVFLSPWQTRIVVPLMNLRDLSIGQFQLWTTPWVMKYGRVNFLSISFESSQGNRILHLTPTTPVPESTAEIDAEVGRWFEAIRAAAAALTGKTPPSSEPAAVSVSAQAGWSRRAMPLFLALLVCDVLLVWRSQVLADLGPDTLFVLAGIGLVLFGIASAWYALGFLLANRALRRGNLDAVTSDEPPSAMEVSGDRPPGGAPAPVRLSWMAVGSALLAIPSWLLALGTLNRLHESLGADGLPPPGFSLAVSELLLLGTGGFVGLLALFLGAAALREIRESGGTALGARLAVTGLLGIPTGLLFKTIPLFAAAEARSLGWQPAPGQGEFLTGAVLIGCFVLVVGIAWTLRRWAKAGQPERANSEPSMRDAAAWTVVVLALVACGGLAWRTWPPSTDLPHTREVMHRMLLAAVPEPPETATSGLALYGWQCQLPANHVAAFSFTIWTNGLPRLHEELSGWMAAGPQGHWRTLVQWKLNDGTALSPQGEDQQRWDVTVGVHATNIWMPKRVLPRPQASYRHAESGAVPADRLSIPSLCLVQGGGYSPGAAQQPDGAFQIGAQFQPLPPHLRPQLWHVTGTAGAGTNWAGVLAMNLVPRSGMGPEQ